MLKNVAKLTVQLLGLIAAANFVILFLAATIVSVQVQWLALLFCAAVTFFYWALIFMTASATGLEHLKHDALVRQAKQSGRLLEEKGAYRRGSGLLSGLIASAPILLLALAASLSPGVAQALDPALRAAAMSYIGVLYYTEIQNPLIYFGLYLLLPLAAELGYARAPNAFEKQRRFLENMKKNAAQNKRGE